jgi:hypothetical protein
MGHGVHDVDFLALIDERAKNQMLSALQFALAEVVSYDEKAEPPTAVFKTLPDGVPTGDIPIGTAWAGTPGEVSGAAGGPEVGTLALLAKVDPAGQVMKCLAFFPSAKNLTPPVPAGEYWVFHKSGSYVKLGNDKTVKVYAAEKVLVDAQAIQLSDSLDILGDDDAIVRKKDLQAVINYVKGHKHVGNFGSPTSEPIIPPGDADASSVAKAK